MVDAAWLADLADKGGVVPRCQDVPEEAKVSLAEMEAWDDAYTVGALIISYPWLDRNQCVHALPTRALTSSVPCLCRPLIIFFRVRLPLSQPGPARRAAPEDGLCLQGLCR